MLIETSNEWMSVKLTELVFGQADRFVHVSRGPNVHLTLLDFARVDRDVEMALLGLTHGTLTATIRNPQPVNSTSLLCFALK